MATLCFHFCGLEVRAELSGDPAYVLGSYEHYPARGGEPDVELEVEIVEGLGAGEAEGPNFPAFETVAVAKDCIEIRRRGTQGRLTWLADRRIRGTFRTHQAPTNLEAILRVATAMVLPHHDTLLLHSSAVATQDGAHVFSGLSGAGKSTISQMIGDHGEAQKIADELLLVTRRRGPWEVELAPFKGGEGLPMGEHHRLLSINLLRQANAHQRRAISATAAMDEMCRHTVNFARDPGTSAKVLDLLAELVSQVPCFELAFAKNPSVGEVLGITCYDPGRPIPWGPDGDGDE